MDTIVYENEQYDAPGGPASYCSLAARKQKHDVNLYTKFGSNYPLEEFFNENKIITHNALSSKDTTKSPHLILLVLDDLGWADVGYHGSDFATPNIDALVSRSLAMP